jgi:hypothetical protein
VSVGVCRLYIHVRLRNVGPEIGCDPLGLRGDHGNVRAVCSRKFFGIGFGRGNICYMQAGGCQNEEVRAEISFTKFFQDTRLGNSPKTRALAYDKAVETAYAKAIAKLGLEGWELVSTPGLEFDNYFQNAQRNYTVQEGDKDRKSDLYFKRPRQ